MAEIKIRRRAIPDRLAYLAAKLREGDGNREAVALSLEVLADEMSTSETPAKMQLLELLTKAELDDLVCGYTNEKLADLYSTARLHPGTDWDRRLSAEIRRRGLSVAANLEGGQ